MPMLVAVAALAIALAAGPAAHAQVPVQASPDHARLLASPDPKLAANKKLVYDFWREVFEGGHMELADKYLAESYLQHNPNVPTGRRAFGEFSSRITTPKAIESRVKAPLVAIVADGDIVVLAFARENADPADPAKESTTTWFDMFRIQDGRIAEHWDPAQKR